MKRRIFFWLEKLKITPAERKTISGLMILLVITAGLNMVLSPSIPFEDDQYHELEQQFNKRSAMLKSQEEELMKQYNPSEKAKFATAQVDTITADSTDQDNVEENKSPSNEVVNINKAGIEALESLPGIGPSFARRIIDYREENGSFESVEELKKIKGIAQKRLDKLKPFVKLKDPK